MESNIIDEIKNNLPAGKISSAGFEGANIVLYTKDKDFFLDDNGIIKEIVNKIKKRVELKPDPQVTMDPEKAEKIIKKIISDEAQLSNIIFDPQRSNVILEVEKPGIAIGKEGENLQKIKEETFWVPIVQRTPPIKSKIIDNIRNVLYQNNDYRRKFLNSTGKRIYNGWLRKKKEEWIRVTYLGGARQVGRSAILLQTPESRVLLDCGIDVAASGDDMYPYLESPEFKIDELDAVIVSHAHMDHSGLIPYLFKFGYEGPVYCTAPTRDVMALMQLDFIKIQKWNAQEPIYTSKEVKEMVKHTITLDYDQVTDITPDVRITLYNAGHILGSSMVHMHVGNGLHNILYTGDLKYGKTHLLSPAITKFPRLETLMIESTYGGRNDNMSSPEEEKELLAQLINSTIERKGKVLLPVLGSGRAQEIIVTIEELIRNNKIEKEVPIYIDGLVWDITAIHTAYPKFLNKNIREQIFNKDNNPFLMPNIKRIGSQKERKDLIENEGPCIILATSGMLVGGPSVEYIRQLGDNPKNTLIFSCYQGKGSMGRRIQRGEREIAFKEGQRQEMLQLKMDVETIQVSGHSDRMELINFIKRCNPRPRKVIINHGENSKTLDLASSIHKKFHIETQAPRNLEAVRIK